MENTLNSVSARELQALSKAARNSQVSIPTEKEDYSGVDNIVRDIIGLTILSAKEGKSQIQYSVKGKSDQYITRICVGVKNYLNDCMVIAKLGHQEIVISWLESNEA